MTATDEGVIETEAPDEATEVTHLRRALAASEARFSSLFRTTPLPSTITSLDGRYVDVSDTFCELSGYSREDVVGKSSVDLDIWVDPADRDRMVQMFKERGSCRGLEVQFRMKDSSIVIVDLAACFIEIDGIPLIYSVTRDLTQQRRVEEERRRMESHVEQAQRLESLGVLAGGIAHDFNNMLAVIVGNATMGKKRLLGNNAEIVERCLDEIEHAAMQARNLTQQLLTFARGGVPQREPMALTPVVREAAAFALAGSRHECELEIPDDLWAVDADSGQLRQVVHNLVLNADQSMSKPGTIRVRAMNVTEDESPTGKWVKVSVIDSGAGIPPEIESRLFDPFFTTKDGGTGLGLAICKSIVLAHGGRLELEETRHPSGSTFTFWIPAARRDAAPVARKRRPAGLERSVHVLVLDDHPALVKVMKSGLEIQGHRVQAVGDGSEAVEAYRLALARGDRFDVVIMDLTIRGGTGGLEALERMKDLDPSVVAIAASGYSNDPVMADYRAHGFAGRLPKPFRPSDLDDAVAVALASHDAP